MCVGILGQDRTGICGGAYGGCFVYLVPATAGGTNHEDAAAMSWDVKCAPLIAHSDKKRVSKLQRLRVCLKSELTDMGDRVEHLEENGIASPGVEVDSDTILAVLAKTQGEKEGERIFLHPPRRGTLIKVKQSEDELTFIVRCELPEGVGNKGGTPCQKFTFALSLVGMHCPLGSRYFMIHPQSIGTRQTPALQAESVRIGIGLAKGIDGVYKGFDDTEGAVSVLCADVTPQTLYKEACEAMSEGFVFDCAYPFYSDLTGEFVAIMPALAAYMVHTDTKHPLFQISGASSRVDSQLSGDKAPGQECVLSDVERVSRYHMAEANSFLGRQTGCEHRLTKVTVCREHMQIGCTCSLEERADKRNNKVLLTTETIKELMYACEVANINLEVTQTREMPAPYRFRTVNEPTTQAQINKACEKMIIAERLAGSPCTSLELQRSGRILISGEMAKIMCSTLCSLFNRNYKPDALPLRGDYCYQLEPHCNVPGFAERMLRGKLQLLLTKLEALAKMVCTVDENSDLLAMQHPGGKKIGRVTLIFPATMEHQVINMALFVARNHVPVWRLQMKSLLSLGTGLLTGLQLPFTNAEVDSTTEEGIVYQSWSEQHYSAERLREVLRQVPLRPEVADKLTDGDAVKLGFRLLPRHTLRAHPLLLGKDLMCAIAPETSEEEVAGSEDIIADAFAGISRTIKLANAAELQTLHLSYSNIVLAPSPIVSDTSQSPTLRCTAKKMSFMRNGVTGLPVGQIFEKGKPIIAYEMLENDQMQKEAVAYLRDSCPYGAFNEWTFETKKVLPYCTACGACERSMKVRGPKFVGIIKGIEKTGERGIHLESSERWTEGSDGSKEALAMYRQGIETSIDFVQEVLGTPLKTRQGMVLDW
jgi:hypothetical protein